MNVIPVPACPATIPPVHVSRLQELVLDRVITEVRQLCVPGWDWGAMVRGLVCALDMNKVELVAWMQVLRKALLGEREDGHFRAVQFSAYLAKSLLSPENLDAAWKGQIQAFKSDYEAWLLTHSHCSQLSMKQLHLQFIDISMPSNPRLRPTLNSVVDNIMHAEPVYAPEEHSAVVVPVVERLRVEAFPPAGLPRVAPIASDLLR